jgi:hypothetical protein
VNSKAAMRVKVLQESTTDQATVAEMHFAREVFKIMRRYQKITPLNKFD